MTLTRTDCKILWGIAIVLLIFGFSELLSFFGVTQFWINAFGQTLLNLAVIILGIAFYAIIFGLLIGGVLIFPVAVVNLFIPVFPDKKLEEFRVCKSRRSA